MNRNDRLKAAMKAQFDWIPILITDRRRYSSRDRRRALVYAFIPFAFIFVFVMQTWHPIMSWVCSFLLQATATTLTVVYYGFVMDYSNETTDPVELERLLNPIIVATFSIRLFIMLHSLLMRSWIMVVAGSVEVAYVYYAASQSSLLVDATTVWKDIKRIRRDTQYRLGIQVLLVAACVFNLIYGLFKEDSM